MLADAAAMDETSTSMFSDMNVRDAADAVDPSMGAALGSATEGKESRRKTEAEEMTGGAVESRSLVDRKVVEGKAESTVRDQEGRGKAEGDEGGPLEAVSSYIGRVLEEEEDSEEERASQSLVTRALRELVISLRNSPWFAAWLLVFVASAIGFFSDLESRAPAAANAPPIMLVASVLGLTTTKVVAAKGAATGMAASAAQLGQAGGATWRASGGAGILSFYLRSVFAGKRLRLVEYPGEPRPVRGGARRAGVRSVTVRTASARALRVRVAREHGLRQADVALYQWMAPGVFERISAVGDLTLVPEFGFIVWARPGVVVPSQGPLLPPEEKPKPQSQSAAAPPTPLADSSPAAVLREVASLELPEEVEGRLVALALVKDERLLALHDAFGGGRGDRRRFKLYATQLVEQDESSGH